jgi:hypothetical protein
VIVRLAIAIALLAFPGAAAAVEPVPAPLVCPSPDTLRAEGARPESLELDCLVALSAHPQHAGRVALAPVAIAALVGADGSSVRVADGRISVEEGLLWGTVGCNEHSAPVDISSDNYLLFMGSLASTAMSCPALDSVERLFVAILSGDELRIEPDRLTSSAGAILADMGGVVRSGSAQQFDDELEQIRPAHIAHEHERPNAGELLAIIILFNAAIGALAFAQADAIFSAIGGNVLIALALGAAGGFLVGRANPGASGRPAAKPAGNRSAPRRRARRP